jgi:hypothetical protein
MSEERSGRLPQQIDGRGNSIIRGRSVVLLNRPTATNPSAADHLRVKDGKLLGRDYLGLVGQVSEGPIHHAIWQREKTSAACRSIRQTSHMGASW